MKITFYTNHLRGPEHVADFRIDADFGGLWSHMVRGHIMRSRDDYAFVVLWPCMGGKLFMNTPSTREDTQKAGEWVLQEWKAFQARGAK